MPMLDDDSPLQASEAPLAGGSEPRQRRQMLAALALLLVALALVLIKDRQFWFPTAAETEAGSETDTGTQGQSQPNRSTFPPAQASSKTALRTAKPASTTPAAPADMAPVVTNRAVLPPLEVEVVAGDEHRLIRPDGTSIKVDLQPRTPATSSAQAGAGGDHVAAAAERARLSPDATRIVSHSVEPNYPLLAKQMKVQGAVVLQALIGKEGSIQDLQVVSGPTILSSAAREAVKQWRFKPYFQAGLAVETEARITVNFTISTY